MTALQNSASEDQQDDDHGREGETVVGERPQTVADEVLQQKAYCQVPHDRGRNEARPEEQGLVAAHARSGDLGQAQAPRTRDDRGAHEKGEPGRLLALESQEQPERDRRSRARDAREERCPCARPMPSASGNRSLEACRLPLLTASARRKRAPTAARFRATSHGERTAVSKNPSKKNPRRAAGTVAMRIR